MYNGHSLGRIPCVSKRDSVFQACENRKLLQVSIVFNKPYSRSERITRNGSGSHDRLEDIHRDPGLLGTIVGLR